MREMKMLANKKQYDLVSEDGYDSRIPLHNDDAFNHGIHFQAKYIGTLDVPRPSSRVEIVAAMRRIRYEFKAKAIKKKKVSLTISIDGVKVSLRKKRKDSINEKSSHSHWSTDDNKLLVMHHPIFRIFYVSHDSQDLKIWSYIARDGPTNIFKCNVFKAYKKSQAMRIVRTIGQAFEVCHKLSITGGQMTDTDRSGHFSEDSDLDSKSNKEREQKNNKQKEKPETVGVSKYDGKVSPPAELALKQAQDLLLSMAAKTPRPESGTTVSSTLGSPVLAGDVETESHYSLTSHHQMQLLRQQVEQQQHQTQIAVSQIHLLKDQLAAESAARIEAQARAHQLLLHNRVMLDQMSELVHRLQELEIKIHGVSPTENLLNLSTEMPIMLDPTTPQVGPVYTPEMESLNESYLSAIPEPYISKNDKSEFDTDSPDSGHKEMSSESLSLHILKPDGIYWQSLLKGQPVSFSSPETFMSDPSGHIVDFSSVTGNPFANGFEDDWDHSQFLKDREGAETIITPLPLQDASGNRLELKLTKTPKIDPPPEFRNSKSYRDSQISEQSQDSSSSSQDGNVQLKIDSDYFSTTASNASSQVNHNSNTDWGQNQNHVESRFDKYFTEKHENNNASSSAKHELNLDLVGITSLESSTKGDNSSNSPVVSHSLDSPSSQTKLIIKPAPPPPPPRRTETTLSYNN